MYYSLAFRQPKRKNSSTNAAKCIKTSLESDPELAKKYIRIQSGILNVADAHEQDGWLYVSAHRLKRWLTRKWDRGEKEELTEAEKLGIRRSIEHYS